jgi:hypothetical protein
VQIACEGRVSGWDEQVSGGPKTVDGLVDTDGEVSRSLMQVEVS